MRYIQKEAKIENKSIKALCSKKLARRFPRWLVNTSTLLVMGLSRKGDTVAMILKAAVSFTRIPFALTYKLVLLTTGQKGRAGGRVVCFAFFNGPELG